MNTTEFCSLVSDDFLDDAREIRKLGEGSFGYVYLVETSDGERYAIKYTGVNESEGINGGTLIDIDTLIRLRNTPNVIDIIGICYQNNRIALILEAMDSDLKSFIDTTTTYDRLRLTRKLLNDMVRVAALMETLNITHFDIKPQNILVSSNISQSGILEHEFKVTDFGLAKPLFGGDTAPISEVYTVLYRSPELLAKRDRYTYNIFASDIWAIGITILEFITGNVLFLEMYEEDEEDDLISFLFPGRKILTLMYNIQNPINMTKEDFIAANKNGTITGNLSMIDIVPSSLVEQLDPQIINMLSRMLTFNPDQRPSGINLLSEFNEEINPEYLITLLSTVHPRLNNINALKTIIEVSQLMSLSKASPLIAIEIFTRYLAVLPIDVDSNIYIKALASLKIASDFAETYFYPGFSFANYVKMLDNVNITDIIEMEKDILKKINFQIYDLNLGPVIERAYSKNIDLGKIDLSQFTEPPSRWLAD